MNSPKRYNKIDLNTLGTVVSTNSDLEISNQDEIKGKELIIIKRDGREEPYSVSKMKKVALWATGNNETLADILLEDTRIKLHDRIKVSDVFKQIINTAVNKISLLYPEWEMVSAKLFLLELYKDTWNIADGNYPHLNDVIQKGLQSKLYSKQTFSKYNEDEINELNDYIDTDRDFLFNYKGVVTITEKYCLNYTKTKKLELPQLAYMRVAMALMCDEKDKLTWVKKLYDAISKHNATLATPIMLNAGTKNQQLSSCVLSKLSDDTDNILDTIKNLGKYSKFKGGTALDISELRAAGSYISGNQGYSSGPVPFVKMVESTMKAFNQGSTRPGSCVITFQWWHIDHEDMIVLKSNGGTDENRARGLKYTLKVNDLYFKRIIDDEYITLFDPKDVSDLIGKFGNEFEKLYEEYENKTNIRKKRVKARELWFKDLRERTETGNIYLFHEENVNNSSMLNRYVNSSNLCVSGDTKIDILIDDQIKQIIEIQELGEYLKEFDIKVRSFDTDIAQTDEYKPILDFAKTNSNAKVMKITDTDTGVSIKCTPDHKIWTENRGYVMAQDLKEDDELKIR